MLIQECASLRKKWQQSSQEVNASGQTMASLQKQLEQKDEQITELMHEGERYSKQELKYNQIIKKLREKEKSHDKSVEGLT